MRTCLHVIALYHLRTPSSGIRSACYSILRQFVLVLEYPQMLLGGGLIIGLQIIILDLRDPILQPGARFRLET